MDQRIINLFDRFTLHAQCGQQCANLPPGGLPVHNLTDDIGHRLSARDTT